MSEKKKKSLAEVFEAAEEPYSSRSSPLDELLEEEEKELVREAKKLKLQEILQERRRRLQETSGQQMGGFGFGMGGQQNLGTMLFSSLVAQGLKPEEVKQYLSALTPETISALGALNANNPMIPFLIYSMTRQNPQGLTVKDVVEIAEKMRPPAHSDGVNVAQLITAIAEVVKPKESTNVVELFTKFVQPLVEQRISFLEKELESYKNRPGFIQELAQKKDELEALRILLGAGAGESRRLEEMKLNLDFQRWKTEQELAMRRWMMEQGMAKERIRTVVKELVKPVLDRTKPLMDELTTAGKRRLQPTPTPGAPMQVQPTPTPTIPVVPKDHVALMCDHCHNLITVKQPLPEQITCPNCGAVYRKKKGEKERGEEKKEEGREEAQPVQPPSGGQ